MRNPDHPPHYSGQSEEKASVKVLIREIIASKNIDSQKRLIRNIAADLKISFFECAAALAYLNKHETVEIGGEEREPETAMAANRLSGQSAIIRFVRYRLGLGRLHHVSVEEIKRVLVEESGVDIKNITNARIYDTYTLIDLPDEMPQEIFHHLKTVEINQQILDIRRIKNRPKMRSHRKSRSSRKAGHTQAKESSG